MLPYELLSFREKTSISEPPSLSFIISLLSTSALTSVSSLILASVIESAAALRTVLAIPSLPSGIALRVLIMSFNSWSVIYSADGQRG